MEAKYNHNHDERGRFTFGSGFGGSGSGSGSITGSGNVRQSASLGTDESWMDKFRSVFGNKPTKNPAAEPSRKPTFASETIAEISEYTQTGKDKWRSSNDKTFIVAAAYYNYKYHLTPNDPGYRTPQFMKAWAMVESGGNRDAFLSDPFQVNNIGDWANPKDATKFKIAGLVRGAVST